MLGAWRDEFEAEARDAQVSEARKLAARSLAAEQRPHEMQLALAAAGVPTLLIPASPRGNAGGGSQASTPRGRAPSPRGGGAKEPMRALPPRLEDVHRM